MNQREPWELSIEVVSAVCDAWAVNHIPSKGNARELVFISIAAPASTIMGFRGLIHGTSGNKPNASLSPLFTPEDDNPPERITKIHTTSLRKGRQFQRPLSGLQRQHHYICLAAEGAGTGATQDVSQDAEPDEEESAVQSDKFYIFAPIRKTAPTPSIASSSAAAPPQPCPSGQTTYGKPPRTTNTSWPSSHPAYTHGAARSNTTRSKPT